MGNEIPPDWARARAQDLARKYREARNWNPTTELAMFEAFARYIAAHEEKPVDPLEDALQGFYSRLGDPPASDWEGGYDAKIIREELAKRGLQIVEMSDV